MKIHMFVTPNASNFTKFVETTGSQDIWEIEYCLFELTKRSAFQRIGLVENCDIYYLYICLKYQLIY